MIAFYFKGEMFGKRGYYIALRHADYAFYFGTLTTAKQAFCKEHGIEKMSFVKWRRIED